jgi:hypothetical protein
MKLKLFNSLEHLNCTLTEFNEINVLYLRYFNLGKQKTKLKNSTCYESIIT